jgi:hypothetical protein
MPALSVQGSVQSASVESDGHRGGEYQTILGISNAMSDFELNESRKEQDRVRIRPEQAQGASKPVRVYRFLLQNESKRERGFPDECVLR